MSTITENPSFLESWHWNVRVNHVHDDWSVAKPREECTPFTYKLYTAEDPYPNPYRQDVYNKPDVKAQERLLPKLERAASDKMRRSKVTPLAGFLAQRYAKVYAR